MLQAIDTEGHIHSEGHVANLPLLYSFFSTGPPSVSQVSPSCLTSHPVHIHSK